MPYKSLEAKKAWAKRYNASHRKEQSAYHKKWAKKNRDKVLGIRRKSYQTHRLELVKKMHEYRKKNPLKCNARRILGYAIKKGRIKRLPCWCGKKKSEAHHPNYSSPLEVVWLCRPHHAGLHSNVFPVNDLVGKQIIAQAVHPEQVA